MYIVCTFLLFLKVISLNQNYTDKKNNSEIRDDKIWTKEIVFKVIKLFTMILLVQEFFSLIIKLIFLSVNSSFFNAWCQRKTTRIPFICFIKILMSVIVFFFYIILNSNAFFVYNNYNICISTMVNHLGIDNIHMFA